MIRRDYFLRMIEQFFEALARIITKRKNGAYDQASLDIEQVCKQFVGLKYDLIKDLTPEALIDLLKLGGELDLSKAIILAELLKEDGELCELQRHVHLAVRRYLSSLCLFIESFHLRDKSGRDDADHKIQSLIQKLTAYKLPLFVQLKLIGYYEAAGRFSKAEDVLFEALESGEPDILQYGIAFYERLLEKPDDVLERGNLPRHEVEEGLRELKSRLYKDKNSKESKGGYSS